MKNILVLGGHGFMGKNIQKIFKSSPYNMFYESRRTGFDVSNLEITTKKLIKIAPDIIIFAAAHVGSIGYVSEFAADVVNDNSQMYLNLYKAVAAVNPKIIIINPISNCSYPGIIDIQHEKSWWDGPIHPSVESYGMPKKLGFIISECYRKQYGIKTLNLILANAYGPNDPNNENRTHAMNGIIMRMLRAQNKNKKEFTIWGSGTPIREWIYMPDAARLIKNIIDNEKYNIPNPINVGQEEGVSILESAITTRDLLNYNVDFIFDKSKQDGAPIKILGNKTFNKYFPDFKFTEVSQGIQTTINYYKKQHII
jgi:GDP-L-fucose synthase